MVRKALNGQQLVACTQVISTGAQGLASIIEWKRQCGAKFVGPEDAPMYNLDNEINGHLVKALDKKPHGAVLLRGKTSKHPDLRLVFNTAECLAETITQARAHKSQNVKLSDSPCELSDRSSLVWRVDATLQVKVLFYYKTIEILLVDNLERFDCLM